MGKGDQLGERVMFRFDVLHMIMRRAVDRRSPVSHLLPPHYLPSHAPELNPVEYI